jgi:excinuclease ABC subunit A
LLGVGLDYLTLGRTAPTLSGGESQRIRLAGRSVQRLVGVLYILDEPSIGLHPRDNDRLIETLERLRDAGNTLIVVEHDEDTMRAADLIVDFGPGPGRQRWRIVAAGNVDDVSSNRRAASPVQFLSGTRAIEPRQELATDRSRNNCCDSAAPPSQPERHRRLDPARRGDLRDGRFGQRQEFVDRRILEPALARELNGAESGCRGSRFDQGMELLDKTIAIDQSPIGRTPRSNPATYVKVFDEIRNLFANVRSENSRLHRQPIQLQRRRRTLRCLRWQRRERSSRWTSWPTSG